MAMLRPASEMKDSGIEWYGTCPVLWSRAPLYSALTEINQKNDPIVTTNILSLTNTEGVIPYSERGNQGNKSKENFEEYKVVYPNTIVANSMNILIGSVGLSAYEGCVSPVYYVYEAKPHYDIRYLNYLFSMEAFQKRLRQFANGIMEIRLRVSSHDILHQNVMMPSFEEQKAIADYLDDRCSKIDEIIAEATASIEEYKELKQAVIDSAITYGLNSDRDMIQSDSEWVRMVPVEWRKIKLGWICSFHNGDRSDRYPSGDDFVNEGIPFAGADSLNGTFVDKEKCRFIRREHYEKLSGLKIQKNDILYTLRGSTIGKCAIADFNNGTVASSLTGIRVERLDDVNPMFLLYWLQSICENNQRTVLINGSTAPNLSAENVRQYKMFLPSLNEQNEIVVYLNDVIKKYDDIIMEKQETVKLVTEYKKSLIYEVVTGKKRVVV